MEEDEIEPSLNWAHAVRAGGLRSKAIAVCLVAGCNAGRGGQRGWGRTHAAVTAA